MPGEDSSFIATHPPRPEVFIFDYSKQPTQPPSDGVCRPLLKLKGHQKDGYGLSWNPLKKGLLASGADDGIVCVWDVDANTSAALSKTAQEVDAKYLMAGHDKQVVEDVCWNYYNDSLLATCGDDKNVCLWDLRNVSSSSSSSSASPGRGVNILA